MRKFFLFVVMLAVGMTSAFADCQDGPYGLQINGTKVVDAPKFGDPDAQGRVQYKASCVELAVGDEIKLINQSCDATWMVDLDPYGSYQKFTGGKSAGKLTCNEAGSYDFYIKLSGSVGDLVYVGPGDNCSGGGGGGCQDGPYGLQLNGTTVIDAPSFGEPDDQGRAQYKASCVKLSVGDEIKLINQSCDATWMVDLDPYGSYQKFTGGKSAGKITCNEAGSYDFYIKLSSEVGDVLYIGPGDGCPAPYDPSGTYYIAGSGTAASDWCCGKDWVPDGCMIHDGKVTYTNLPKGTYMFKITNGTWDSNWGSESLDGMCTSTGVVGDDGRNITFKIYKKADVEITFDGTICVKITGDETPDVPERPDYAKSVPEKCPDVMLQAFYYDSYNGDAPGNVVINGNKLGDTKWSTLLKNSGDIGMYFDMVWLPPSGKSEGGTGYHQTQYSNQNSAWGSKDELVEFINRMHTANTKVVADIVINHAGCKSSWCDFYTQYFTPYGTFEPVASWICKTDEVNGQSEDMTCKNAATGTDDGGYNGQDNYASARDWAHADTRVQDMMKAYLKWMKNVIGYDGWRYDYAQGFKGKYINMYNSASKNYFSVCEFWNGDMSKIKSYLNDCGWNTTVFDFSNKYCAIQGIADGDYGKCVGSGLQGTGDGRYAVTFVDSHDTYFGCKGGRDNQDEIGGCGKSMEDYNKDRVLAANAYILSRPGIPCVFYPHWMKYKTEINKMVMARQITGVHSESVCSEESSGNGFYKVTVTGTKGSIRLLLGPNSDFGNTPSGYSLAYKGGNFAMYYKTTEAETPRLKMTAPQKFSTQNFTVTITAAALSGTPEIYYTTDGTEPTTSSSTKYTSPFNVSGTTTVKAIAVLNGKSSAVMSATYTYKAPQSTPILLRFTHDDTWTGDAYVFLWDGGSAGGWPGTKMSLGVDGWYRYQLPEGVKSTKFIFNNGNKGLQTGDLVTDCDVCYQWRNGCEEQDEEYGEIEVPFGIALSPESSKFRDQTVGIDVTITVVGVPSGQTPTIYYTTNGTDPTTSSTSSTTNPLKLNFKNTTELRAMAVAGSQKTSVVKATYTYKEPQQGPITVSFKEPSWKKVNLYAWTTDASQTPLLGAWPGTTLTQQDKDGAYYHTFDAQYKTVNIIWNNGSVQSSDILVDENTCFTWDATEKDAVPHDCEEMAIMSVQEAPLLNLNAPMYNILGQQVDATYSGIVIQNGYKYLIIK